MQKWCDCGAEMTTNAEMCADCFQQGCTTEIHKNMDCLWHDEIERESAKQDEMWEKANGSVR